MPKMPPAPRNYARPPRVQGLTEARALGVSCLVQLKDQCWTVWRKGNLLPWRLECAAWDRTRWTVRLLTYERPEQLAHLVRDPEALERATMLEALQHGSLPLSFHVWASTVKTALVVGRRIVTAHTLAEMGQP